MHIRTNATKVFVQLNGKKSAAAALAVSSSPKLYILSVKRQMRVCVPASMGTFIFNAFHSLE